MKRAVFILLFAYGCSADNPGPLPEVTPPGQPPLTSDWFPNVSENPTPLDEAVLGNRLDQVRVLLEKRADPNTRWGRSGDHFPLQEALDSDGYRVPPPDQLVPLLLAHGADPNAKWCPFETRRSSESPSLPSCTSEFGSTPLSYAATRGNPTIVDALLQAGADPRPRDWRGGTALDYAYDEITFELISRALFSDLATRDRKALEWLAQFRGGRLGEDPRDNTPLVRALLVQDWGYYPPPRLVPLYTVETYVRAYEDQILNRVRTLLRIGANPNERTESGRTPLSVALAQGELRVARVLLAGGADPNQRWCERFPYPRVTPDSGHLFLSERGKDPSCSEANGMTPLMFAAAISTEAVSSMLEFGADRNLRDWAGRSALHYATTRNSWDLLKSVPPMRH